MQEMVDIVDKKDNVSYSTTKDNAHKNGLLHRTIIAQVIDSKGRWILVKQAQNRQDAGQYVSPVGGHVRAGESKIEALRREAFEELGLKDFTYKFIGKAIFNRRVLNRFENHYFVLYKIFSNEKPLLNHESESYKIFTKEQLKKKLKTNPAKFGQAFHFVAKNFYPKLLIRYGKIPSWKKEGINIFRFSIFRPVTLSKDIYGYSIDAFVRECRNRAGLGPQDPFSSRDFGKIVPTYEGLQPLALYLIPLYYKVL